MPIQSQIRLQQLTGSAGELKAGVDAYAAPSTAALLTGSDLKDVLGMVAAAVHRIHGQASDEVFNANPGEFYQDLMVGSGGDKKVQFRDSAIFLQSSADGQLDIQADGEIELTTATVDVDASAAIELQAATDSFFKSSGGDVTVEAEGAAKKVTIKGDHANGTAVHIDGNAAATSVVDIDAGALDIDVTAATNIDTVGFDLNAGSGVIELTTTGNADMNFNALALDMTDSSAITITSSEDAEDLVISQVGANDSSIIVQAAGTGTDAIKLQATAGGVELSSLDVFSISSSNNGIQMNASTNSFLKASAGDVTIEAQANNRGVTVKGDHETGVAVHIDGDQSVQSVVDIDAGILDVDASASISLQAAGDSEFKSSGGNIQIEAEGQNKSLVLKGDHESGVAVHIDGNAATASVVDIDAGTLQMDAAGTFTLDGADDSIVRVTGAGKDLQLEATGGGAQKLLLQSAGTGVDALHLNATAGGMSLNVIDGQTLAAGLAGGVELMLQPSSVAAEEKASLKNTSGTARDAIKIESVAGGLALTGSSFVEVKGGFLEFASADSNVMASGHMRWANGGEFAGFIAKPLFSNSTTLVGALNALADAASGGVVGKAVITGSAVSVLQLTGSGMSESAGFTNSISTAEATPANFDVFVNGQLLASGTGASGAGGDYGVKYAAAGSAALNFQFALEADDVVLVKTSAQQS